MNYGNIPIKLRGVQKDDSGFDVIQSSVSKDGEGFDQIIQEFDIENVFEGKSKLERRQGSSSKIILQSDETPHTVLFNNNISANLEHRL